MPPPTLYARGNLSIIDNGKTILMPDVVPIDYIKSFVQNRSGKFGNHVKTYKEKILLVEGKTGSGKSTAMPVELYRLYRSKRSSVNEQSKSSILCTQPKILTAIDIAEKTPSSFNSDFVLGSSGNVGYITGIFSNAPKSGLIYSTLGVLTAQLNSMSDDEFINLYEIIIIDEAHERSVELDMAFLMLFNIFKRNDPRKLPFLIITSATFDYLRYAKYFEVNNIVRVDGYAFEKFIHWLPDKMPVDNIILSAVNVVLYIHSLPMEKSDNDIMVFVPGMGEATKINEILEEIKEIGKSKMNFVVSAISGDKVNSGHSDYAKLNQPIYENGELQRKIILTTSVAETGLTLDTLKYVVDCGYTKSGETYFPHNADGVIMKAITKDSSMQRRGRIGRKSPGHFYPLYTEATFNEMGDFTLPRIISAGVQDIYLKLIIEQQKHKIITGKFPSFNISDINLLDMPSIESILIVNAKAYFYGFISDVAKMPTLLNREISFDSVLSNNIGYGITFNGLLASKFIRINIEEAALLFYSMDKKLNILDIITGIAFKTITYSELFDKNGDKKFIKFLKSKNICDSIISNEIYVGILLYNECIKNLSDDYETFCKLYNIKPETINAIMKERIEILSDIINNEFNPWENLNNFMEICISYQNVNADTINYSNYYINSFNQVLYDTYKFNIILNDSGTYKSFHGLPIQINKKTKHNIITNKLNIKGIVDVNKYIVEPSFIIILDFDYIIDFSVPLC